MKGKSSESRAEIVDLGTLRQSSSTAAPFAATACAMMSAVMSVITSCASSTASVCLSLSVWRGRRRRRRRASTTRGSWSPLARRETMEGCVRGENASVRAA
eukprot:scaffold160560_cov31-Tisochrysis_lutea.AAC.5